MSSQVPRIPQLDSRAAARAKQVARDRQRYAYDYSWPPGVAMPASLRRSDQWTAGYLLKALDANVAVVVNSAELRATLDVRDLKALEHRFLAGAELVSSKAPRERPASIAGYQEYFNHFERPPLVRLLNSAPWERDRAFAWQRLAGVNPMVIRNVTRLPDHFPVTEAHYAAAIPGGDTLAAAAAEGRLFLADYVALEGAATGTTSGRPKYMTAPLALFAVPSGATALMPVAIQCTQTPGEHAPVFTPRDGFRWRMAQAFVQTADANLHEAVEHLGRTHLVMGAVCMGMRRQLAASHPLRVLLEPHVELTFAINDDARGGLIGRGGVVDRIMGGTIEATLGALKAGMDGFSLQDAAPRRALAARGVLDPAGLPEYPYREDAVPVWDAINGFVRGYVELYYVLDADVAGDMELRAWTDELGSERGGRLRHLRPVNTLEELIELITNVLFIASAQHAALNFSQFPYMGCVPNMAGACWGPAPTLATPDTADELLLRLPPWHIATIAADTAWQLSQIRINTLGDYGHAFSDPLTAPLVRDFRAALDDVERAIRERELRRFLPYPFLLPSTIPASINV